MTGSEHWKSPRTTGCKRRQIPSLPPCKVVRPRPFARHVRSFYRLHLVSTWFGSPGSEYLQPARFESAKAVRLSNCSGTTIPKPLLIRLWMRTAIRKQVTSFGTFLSTLCHEFCHHLDCQRFGWRESWHTRGFYERTAALYHHARGTPVKPLFWVRAPGDRWRIDWPRTNRGA